MQEETISRVDKNHLPEVETDTNGPDKKWRRNGVDLNYQLCSLYRRIARPLQKSSTSSAVRSSLKYNGVNMTPIRKTKAGGILVELRPKTTGTIRHAAVSEGLGF